jgi:hypothetical protein
MVALVCCEQRFSAAPPPLAPESAPSAVASGALESLLTPAADDAGAEVAQARAMTVTLCSASAQPCEVPEGGTSDDEAYRVVFGSGRAEIRSRGQAMTDLYKELRDRTTAGERLAAIPRAARSSGGAFTASAGASAKGSAGEGDDITRCAFHLLDLVDGVGEVVLERLPRFAATGCIVSLGRPGGDAGMPQCLIKEPDRPNRKAP